MKKNNSENQSNTCIPVTQLEKYALHQLCEKEIEKIDNKLNQCLSKSCACLQILDGFYLESTSKLIAAEDPEKIEQFDASAMFERLKPFIQEAYKQKSDLEAKKIVPLTQKFQLWMPAAAVLFLILISLALWQAGGLAPKKNLTQITKNQNIQSKDTSNTQPNQILQDETIGESQKVNKDDTEVNNKSLTEISKESNPLAFQENPQYEALLTATKRGQNYVYDVKPANGTILKDKILFEWKINQKVSLDLKVLDNKGNSLHTKLLSINDSTFEFNISNYQKGLYYWQILDESSILHTGKFLIK